MNPYPDHDGRERSLHRAMIYARVSLDMTGDGRSVARQIEACTNLAAARDYVVIGVETDTQSAYRSKARPGWERVKTAALRGDCDVILAWQLDRITRSIHELEKLIELTESTHVAVATVTGEMDLTTSNGRLLARILGAVARAESELKGTRLALANLDRAKQGIPARNSTQLFGYDRQSNVIEAEAKAIQRAARDVLAGATLTKIQLRWNAAGLMPHSRRTTGRGWTLTGVKTVLTNPRLAGLSTHRGEVVGRGHWKPILRVSTHERLVYELLDQRRIEGGPYGGPTPQTLLSGIAVCLHCGSTHTAAVSDQGIRTYVCRNHHGQVNRAQADEYVRAELIQALTTARGLGVLEPLAESRARASALERTLRDRLDQLAESFARGAITIDQLETATKLIRDQLPQRSGPPKPKRLTLDAATRLFDNATLEGQRGMIADILHVSITLGVGGWRRPEIHDRIKVEARTT